MEGKLVIDYHSCAHGHEFDNKSTCVKNYIFCCCDLNILLVSLLFQESPVRHVRASSVAKRSQRMRRR